MKKSQFIYRFEEGGPRNLKKVGEKGRHLMEMVYFNLPVPSGFVITTEAYSSFLKEGGLYFKIKELLSRVDERDPQSLRTISREIKRLIFAHRLSGQLVQPIIQAYFQLGDPWKEALVAVRASPVNQNLKGDSFLDIRGEANLTETIRKTWASFFSPLNLMFKERLLEEKLAVVVQKMIASQVSGVIYSQAPANKRKILVKAIYGLGELAVEGQVVPNQYLVDKDNLKISQKEIHQPKAQKLSDQEIIKLAKLAKKVQQAYFFPQEIEFAWKEGKIYLLQTRPLEEKEEASFQPPTSTDETPTTATKVYLTLDSPEMAGKIPSFIDGLFFQPELTISQLGIHPKKLIQDQNEARLVNQITEGMKKVCQVIEPKPVIYKLSDFSSYQYRQLVGGKAFEPKETNPLLGLRGGTRHLADESILALELKAMKNLRQEGHNLGLMIPFVRTPRELKKIKEKLTNYGLARSPTFKLWLGISLPANLFLLEEFVQAGLDGLVFQPENLASFALGLDWANKEMAARFTPTEISLVDIFEKGLKQSAELGLLSIFSVQEQFLYSNLLERMVESGINGFSVPLSALERIKELLYQAEKRFVQKRA